MEYDVLQINPEIINIEKYDSAEFMIDIEPMQQIPQVVLRTNKKYNRITLRLFVNCMAEVHDFFAENFNFCKLSESWDIKIFHE